MPPERWKSSNYIGAAILIIACLFALYGILQWSAAAVAVGIALGVIGYCVGK